MRHQLGVRWVRCPEDERLHLLDASGACLACDLAVALVESILARAR
ncbi:MAG: hypothetical protein ACRDTD_12230 [Pseudonocardiaceae bacterium]